MKKYTLQELRTPGTKIPRLIGEVKYTTSYNSIKQVKDFITHEFKSEEYISFGSTNQNSEECILMDKLGYEGKNFIEIPVSEFRRLGLLDEFVLPEKWAVKRTKEASSKVNEWLTKGTTVSYFSCDDEYAHYPNYQTNSGFYGGKHIKPSIQEGYTEITFEQFKEYVLKENTMKKIIGYKLSKEEYLEAAEKIAKFKELSMDENNIKPPRNGTANGTEMYENLKKAGVLDLWFTPVYEEDKVRKIGKYDVVFNTPNIKVGCTWYNKESLTKAKEVLEQPNVQAIKCDGHDLTLTDVNNLLKYFE